MAATSRNIRNSARIIPHAWIQEKVDITDLEASRKKHKSNIEMAGGNLTITALVVMAVTKCLKAFPVFNSSLDVEKDEIVYKDHFHLGIAVDTDRGLLVPVIRDVDKLSLTEIAYELTRISKVAKEHKTKLEDLEGATFTISNLGGIGTTSMNPIINWPQVAILGLSAGRLEPIWIEREFIPRLIIPLTIGFDHRVLNGADVAKFLKNLKRILEDPFLLII
jgi:pyruvate dehydrogenase E2 component (dihydrolipoamide acetyltransferase)